MKPERTVSLAALRRHVVRAQGFATRPRRGRAEDVVAAVRRLSCVQLDSISVVERSHRIVLGSRVGAYPQGTVSRLLREGRLFEYWAHEACLLPVEDWPLFRRRMAERQSHHWWGPVIAKHPRLARKVLAEVEARGPIGARHFGGRSGGMWELKPEKRMLDALWTAGRLVVAGRDGFQRLYDLPERVLPRRALDAPVPSASEWLRALVLKAVTARGALTAAGIVDHYRLRGMRVDVVRAADALAAEGALERVGVADGGPDVWVPAGADLDDPPEPTGAVLVSPFENMLWDRAFSERVLGFRHVIEVYKRAPEREFGYYVLPLVRGDRVVARADLKSDREAGVLRVRAFRVEPGVRRSGALEEAFASALARLARVVGLAPDGAG